MKISTGVAAMKMPDKPPMMNIDTNDNANNIGVVYLRSAAPNHCQLNVFHRQRRVIIVLTMGVMPRLVHADTNMWWPR